MVFKYTSNFMSIRERLLAYVVVEQSESSKTEANQR